MLAGCRRSSSGAPTPAPSALAPLAASDWLVSLSAPGFPPAKLALPLGARRARPIVVALHGDDDRPEWPCGSYHHIARSAFVLCPTGPARSAERFTLGPLEMTRGELRALLPKLKTRFGSHVARGAVVLGAIGPSVEQAIALALEEPGFFSYLILIDGPFERWTSGATERFAKAGGVRVLFVCTTGPECETGAGDQLLRLKRAGADARAVSTPAGRGLDAHTTESIAREWAWLVAGDARWN